MPDEAVISAFSAEQVTKITGLTSRQLSYWDGLGFFKPEFSEVFGQGRSTRFYSFTDVVGLRVLSVLRNQHRISRQKLHKIAETLHRHSKRPWSDLKLMVCNGEVVFINPQTNQGEGAITGQYVMVPIIDHIKHVKNAAAQLSQRTKDQIGQFAQHKRVAHNQRVLAGTRVPVRAIKRFLAAGYSPEDILIEYPSITRRDVEAVMKSLEITAVA
jgi:uncharacterized protein (DUF433 family)